MFNKRGGNLTEVAPLPASFMVTSIVGYIISVLLVYPRWQSWGFAFALVFIMMFIASVISMTYSEVKDPLMIHNKKKVR